MASIAYFLDGAGAEGYAHKADAPQRVQVEVELGRGAREPTHVDDAPADRGRRQF